MPHMDNATLNMIWQARMTQDGVRLRRILVIEFVILAFYCTVAVFFLRWAIVDRSWYFELPLWAVSLWAVWNVLRWLYFMTLAAFKPY